MSFFLLEGGVSQLETESGSFKFLLESGVTSVTFTATGAIQLKDLTFGGTATLKKAVVSANFETLPVVLGNYGDKTSYEARTATTSFTPALSERGRDGINSVSHKRNISFEIEGYAQKLILENFLKGLRGVTPFYFTPYADVVETNNLYTCGNNDYTFVRVAPTTWKFSGTFVRSYRCLT